MDKWDLILCKKEITKRVWMGIFLGSLGKEREHGEMIRETF
jgi:hypothetical protein